MDAIDLHIVLYQPEIPPNTGNIARLCACTGCVLHMVHPLGFDISDRQLRRAGLDYWGHLDIRHYPDWQTLRATLQGNRRWYAFSTKGTRHLWDVQFAAGDALVFGPESRGLPASILADLEPVRIPMRSDAEVRSLNLSSACAIAVYEAVRQLVTA
ncbi:MAG TPA: tRNA (cytidine(34)-2'-O)-methyltransferase [Mariprofundaceae bacterium]|nr:tRNA (cytidine(34)-2'-O)-methyltransferase [Mariprofundaceae bacterium]